MARTPEGKFQDKLRKEVEEMFPGSMTFKTDPLDRQGIPDIFIVYNNKWAVLEGKKDKVSHELASLKEMSGLKQKVNYLLNRFLM